jgi:hypothetical protein
MIGLIRKKLIVETVRRYTDEFRERIMMGKSPVAPGPEKESHPSEPTCRDAGSLAGKEQAP